MSTPFQLYIDHIINCAIDLGASRENPKIVRYTDLDSIFLVSYTQPTTEQIAKLSKEVVWVCNDPDALQYKKAYRGHAFFPGMWQEIFSDVELMRKQSSFYTEFVYAPADTMNEEQLHAPLLPRTLSFGEAYSEDEVVPLSFIRSLVGEGGGGGPSDPTLVRRVDVLEQEVLKLQTELENIDTTYNHSQDFVSTAWRVQHGFGSHPSVIQVMNAQGCMMFPENIIVDENNLNEFIVVFSTPELGRVAAIR